MLLIFLCQVMFAGGRTHMLPNNISDPVETDINGTREDGRNLIDVCNLPRI